MKKYVVIICAALMFAAMGNFSIGLEIKNTSINENFLVEINPTDQDYTSLSLSDPVVIITQPQDGGVIFNDTLEVLGFASDPDGIVFMEWTWQSKYGSYYDNDTIPNYHNMNFRIRVFNVFPGWHKITVTFYDIYDNNATDSVNVTYIPNDPPEKPGRPSGPDTGSIDVLYSFTTHAVDPENDDIKYGWDWDGDNVVDEWTDFNESGDTITMSHSWEYNGIYNIKVKAEDDKGAQSGFSNPHTVHIITESGPDTPSTPSGPTGGKSGVSYSYTTSTTDPQGDRIYYMFDWDDGSEMEWEGPYVSGDAVSASHIWQAKGTYSIKVKAIDDPNSDGDLSDGAESVWSDPLAISMPKVKSYVLLEKILLRFPALQNLLSLFV